MPSERDKVSENSYEAPKEDERSSDLARMVCGISMMVLSIPCFGAAIVFACFAAKSSDVDGIVGGFFGALAFLLGGILSIVGGYIVLNGFTEHRTAIVILLILLLIPVTVCAIMASL